MSDGIVNQPVPFTLPVIFKDSLLQPVEDLTITDFAVTLLNGSDVVKYEKVPGEAATTAVITPTLTHKSGGVYGGTWTPDGSGTWRLVIQHSDYGFEGIQQFEISAASSAASSTLTDAVTIKLFMGTAADAFSDDQIQLAADWAADEIEQYCDRRFSARDYYEWRDGSGTPKLLLPDYPIISIRRVMAGADEALTVTNSSDDASWITANVVDGSLTLDVVGGVNAGSDSLALASYATMAALETAIEALGKGWAAEVVAEGDPKALRPSYATEEGAGTLTLYQPSEEIGGYVPDVREGILQYPYGWGTSAGSIYIDYRAGYETIPAALQQVATRLAADILQASKRDGGGAVQSEKIADYSYTISQAAASGLIGSYRATLAPFRRVKL